MMNRLLGTTVALSSILATCIVIAPAASATINGCGDLSNGKLCLDEYSVGKTGTFTFRVSYGRNDDVPGEITVTLGTQRKNDQITALPDFFGSKKTQNGYAALSKRYSIDKDECVRAVMEHNNKTYIGKWRCP